MVQFPEGFTALIYPGYFWNSNEKCIYSLKRGGVLRPLPLRRRFIYKMMDIPCGYDIYYKGKRKRLPVANIDRYLVKGVYTIPKLEY